MSVFSLTTFRKHRKYVLKRFLFYLRGEAKKNKLKKHTFYNRFLKLQKTKFCVVPKGVV